ncbi:MAG: hypothetical protein MJ248_00105 [Bacilli bacterium]|nr:hypothetical protein [Bacilli bacterium]
MKSKLLLTLISASAVVAAAVAIAPKNAVASFAEGCEHEGNHYDAVAATSTSAGNKEFWACCVCHEQFITEPSKGTWTDQGAYDGELSSSHIAYVAPITASEKGSFANVYNLMPGVISSINVAAGDEFDVGQTVTISVETSIDYYPASYYTIQVDNQFLELSGGFGSPIVANYVMSEGEHSLAVFHSDAAQYSDGYNVHIMNTPSHARYFGIDPSQKYAYIDLIIARDPGASVGLEYSLNGVDGWTNASLSYSDNIAHFTHSLMNYYSDVYVRFIETGDVATAHTVTFVNASEVVHYEGEFTTRQAYPGDTIAYYNVHSTNAEKGITNISISGASDANVYSDFSGFYFTMPNADVVVTFTLGSLVTYTVEDNPGVGSYTITESLYSYEHLTGLKAGSAYYIKAVANSGYQVTGVNLNGNPLTSGNDYGTTYYAFTCPSTNFTIEFVTSVVYSVSYDTSVTGGSMSFTNAAGYSGSQFAPGTRVNINISVSAGYTLNSLSARGHSELVISKDSDTTAHFTMPAYDVVIVPSYTRSSGITLEVRYTDERISSASISGYSYPDNYEVSGNGNSTTFPTGVSLSLSVTVAQVYSNLDAYARVYLSNGTYTEYKSTYFSEYSMQYSFQSVDIKSNMTYVEFYLAPKAALPVTVNVQSGVTVSYTVDGSVVSTLEGNLFENSTFLVEVTSEVPSGYVAKVSAKAMTSYGYETELSNYGYGFNVPSGATSVTVTVSVVEAYSYRVVNPNYIGSVYVYGPGYSTISTLNDGYITTDISTISICFYGSYDPCHFTVTCGGTIVKDEDVDSYGSISYFDVDVTGDIVITITKR